MAELRMFACAVCSTNVGDPGLNSIQCRKCYNWVHSDCAKLNRRTCFARVKHYYCTPCRENHGLMIEWHLDESKEAIDEKEAGDYWEIEKIIGHGIRKDGNRFFTIVWKQGGEEWTIPESWCDGCLDTLQDYCLENNLDPSKIVGKVGAGGKQMAPRYNRDNWVTIEEVKKFIEMFKGLAHYQNDIPVIEHRTSRGLENQDSIYLVRHADHCYVALLIKTQGFAYIADGANFIFNSLRRRAELARILGVELVPCHWEGTYRVDHCGSAAVLIALEFMHAHKHKCYNIYMEAKAWVRDMLVPLMHKYDSAAIKPTQGNKAFKRTTVTCRYCPKRFRTDKLSRVTAHELNCSNKPSRDDEPKPSTSRG